MKINVVRTLSGLKPAYASDQDSLNKIPLNEIVQIEYKKIRNLKFHRKFFALLNLAFNNQSLFNNLEDMRYSLLLGAGVNESRTDLLTGELLILPKSLNFSNMDEIEFSEVYEKVRNYISEWLGCTNQDLEREIEQHF